MAVPHQLLPVVAGFDIVSAGLMAVQLAFAPIPNVFGRPRVPAAGHGTISSSATKVAKVASSAAASATARGGASGWLQNVLGNKQSLAPQMDQAYHSITVKVSQSGAGSSDSWKLILFILMTCLARCAVVLLVSRSVAKGIRQRRAGGRAQDFADTAVFCSIACVTSILVDLFTLNSVFQSRGLTKRGSADVSILGVLGKLDVGSFAAEQLIVSFVEWILFVGVVATNKELARPEQTSRASAARSEQSISQSAESGPSGNQIDDKSDARSGAEPKTVQGQSSGTAGDGQLSTKNYGAITHSYPSSHALSSAGTASAAGADAKAAQGTDTASSDAAVPSVPVTSTTHGVTSQTAPEPGHAAVFQGNGANGRDSSQASAETSTIDGALDAHAQQQRASLAGDGSTAGDGSDIVDMPSDRRTSMQAARERLQRARDNGKVRRRSLWKKIRGKNGETASIAGGDDSFAS